RARRPRVAADARDVARARRPRAPPRHHAARARVPAPRSRRRARARVPPAGRGSERAAGPLMGHEIERKFVVDPARWHPSGAGTLFRQGYLSTQSDRIVRVRIEGDAGKLTIKGRNIGVTRVEFEYPIPLADAHTLLGMCEQPLIEKRRHREV